MSKRSGHGIHFNPKKALILALVANMLSLLSLTVIGIYAGMYPGINQRLSKEVSASRSGEVSLPCLSASIAVGLSCLAAAIALKGVVTAGFAAMVERPEIRSFVLILGGLAEGIAIYGLLIAILILTAAH